MADTEEDEIKKILQPFLAGREGVTDRTGCPDEETLADYLAGVLTEPQRQAVQDHLSSCVFCTGELVSVHKGTGDEAREVPQAWIERARSLVSNAAAGTPFLDLSVRLTETTIELIHTTGHGRGSTTGAGPVALRGPDKTDADGLEIETEMGGFNIAVHVEHVEPDACDVILGIRDTRGGPAEAVRVDLFSEDREQASYLTREGRVVFDHVNRGKYTLPIRDAGTLVGTVRLDIA